MPQLMVDTIDGLLAQAVAGGREIQHIADAVGVTPGYLWKLRHGRAPNVSAVIVAQLAEVLGVPVAALLDVSDSAALTPQPDLLPVVRRLNDVPAARRSYYVTLIDAALEFERIAPILPLALGLDDADLDALAGDLDNPDSDESDSEPDAP